MTRASIAWRAFLVVGCLIVAGYAATYAAMGDESFRSPLKDSFDQRPWSIFIHAGFGALGLLLCLMQISSAIRRGNPAVHRWAGRVTVPVAVVAGLAGLHLAFYSYGGTITHIGFGLLALGTIACPLVGWKAMREKDLARHRAWMIRTFALLFSAVTLRIELFALAEIYGAFLPAYRTVSWLCWVPNVAVAEMMIRALYPSAAKGSA